MEQIQTLVSPLFLKPSRRRAFGTAWTGAGKALLFPIPIVALVFVTLVAWLEP
jgi:superfamily II DNA/RNA helicase